MAGRSQVPPAQALLGMSMDELIVSFNDAIGGGQGSVVGTASFWSQQIMHKQQLDAIRNMERLTEARSRRRPRIGSEGSPWPPGRPRRYPGVSWPGIREGSALDATPASLAAGPSSFLFTLNWAKDETPGQQEMSPGLNALRRMAVGVLARHASSLAGGLVDAG